MGGSMESGGLTLAFGLIILGFVLLGAELLFPSGVLTVIALVVVFVGVTLTFYQSTTAGLIRLAAVIVFVPLAGRLMLHIWPRTWIGRRLFLKEAEENAATAHTDAHQELEPLIGRFGRTLSDLRPSGVANFDGKRVDVITEGIM